MGLEASFVTNADGPHPVEGSAAWRGPDLARTDDWVYRLSPPETAEVEQLPGRDPRPRARYGR
jgi:hypothetical protein